MSTPAGWYPDPQDPHQDRWWNGSGWSDAWQPRTGTPPAPPDQPYGAPYGGVPYGGAVSTAPTAHGPATASLVLGIIGLVLCGLFTGIPAMVMGHRAIREIDESGGRLAGRGLATAGFWTGLVGTLWSALLVVLIVVGLAVGSSESSSSTGSACQPAGTSYC